MFRNNTTKLDSEPFLTSKRSRHAWANRAGPPLTLHAASNPFPLQALMEDLPAGLDNAQSPSVAASSPSTTGADAIVRGNRKNAAADSVPRIEDKGPEKPFRFHRILPASPSSGSGSSSSTIPLQRRKRSAVPLACCACQKAKAKVSSPLFAYPVAAATVRDCARLRPSLSHSAMALSLPATDAIPESFLANTMSKRASPAHLPT